MIILAIETSCDETAVSIVRATGDFPHARYEVLGHALFSQMDLHREYGGVFPSLAKREHAKTVVPMLERVLDEARLTETPHELTAETRHAIAQTLAREPGLTEALDTFLASHRRPALDGIAVTAGPGLEPALWVGINFAKALSLAWEVPLIPVDHMEGHIFISIFNGERLAPLSFPALALLISGGHTELIAMHGWSEYTLIGRTRDDAVGEAFDKVARMLGLPYPGGPEISRLAEEARVASMEPQLALPRPMLTSSDTDFSFSGLKTAVRHALMNRELTDEYRREVALDFENAVTEVLVAKTRRALEELDAQSLIIGGGVAANRHIRHAFTELFATEYPERTLYLPEPSLTTDNALMIALVGHAHATSGGADLATVAAYGNKRQEGVWRTPASG